MASVEVNLQSLQWTCWVAHYLQLKNNGHINHTSQKNNFPLRLFTLLTVITAFAVPLLCLRFAHTACSTSCFALYGFTWCFLYRMLEHMLFCSTVCTQPMPIHELYAIHTGSKVWTSEYLQEVLLLMLASKPVLVSANRSDNGKFSKNKETMTFMHLNPLVMYLRKHLFIVTF